MKYKCLKAECPICKLTGSIQLFMNKSGEVRYARTRHYSHIERFQEATVHLLQNREFRAIENKNNF